MGGKWNDKNERPLVCLLPSSENVHLYWAIPIGNYEHRTPQAKERIHNFMNLDSSDIRSCFYHVGSTNVKSIFFISDVIPITDKYIEREYLNRFSHSIYIIKNKKLITSLEYKLKRILSWENANPNYFRQHITDVKKYLIEELNSR